MPPGSRRVDSKCRRPGMVARGARAGKRGAGQSRAARAACSAGAATRMPGQARARAVVDRRLAGAGGHRGAGLAGDQVAGGDVPLPGVAEAEDARRSGPRRPGRAGRRATGGSGARPRRAAGPEARVERAARRRARARRAVRRRRRTAIGAPSRVAPLAGRRGVGAAERRKVHHRGDRAGRPRRRPATAPRPSGRQDRRGCRRSGRRRRRGSPRAGPGRPRFPRKASRSRGARRAASRAAGGRRRGRPR